MKSVNIKIIFDTRYVKIIDGKKVHPTRIRVTYGTQRMYFSTGHYFSEIAELDKKANKKALLKIKELEAKARIDAEKIDPFDFAAFKKKYLGLSNDVYSALEARINELNSEGRAKTAYAYTNALKSLKKFKTTLNFQDITTKFLADYERWMLKQGRTKSTTGFYMRALRTVITKAFSEGEIKQYPFGKHKYQIPKSRNLKKSLTIEDVQAIVNYKPFNASEERARDFWVFSYLGSGINFRDIAELRHSNIQVEYITFERSKLHGQGQKINIFILPEMAEIIRKWGNPGIGEALVFPVLKTPNNPKRVIADVNQFIKTTNHYMKAIARELGIKNEITTYYARHTYATILMRSGVPVAFISKALGHQNIKTTQSYLGSFEDDQVREIAQKLLPKKAKEG